MTLTVTDVAGYVRRRLDGEPSISMVDLCNRAGVHLVAMNTQGWRWMQRPPVTLRLSSGSNRARLPDDFGKVLDVEGTSSGAWRYFRETDQYGIARLRESNTTTLGGVFYGALVYERDVDGVLAPHFEIFPQSSSNDTSLKLWYSSKWVKVKTDTETIPVPDDGLLETLFIEIVLALAQGHDEADMASAMSRLDAIKLSSMFMDAVASDATQAGMNLGPSRGGMVGPAADGYDWSLYPASISGPGQ